MKNKVSLAVVNLIALCFDCCNVTIGYVRQSLDLDQCPFLTLLEDYPIPVGKTWVSVQQVCRSVDSIQVTSVCTRHVGPRTVIN